MTPAERRLQVGIEAGGTRSDFQGYYGGSISPVDRKATWPLTLDRGREMSRNGGYDRYRAALADENAWTRSRRLKCCKFAINSRLRQFYGFLTTSPNAVIEPIHSNAMSVKRGQQSASLHPRQSNEPYSIEYFASTTISCVIRSTS